MAAEFREFVQAIHAALPKTDIWYLSMKPTTTQAAVWPEMSRANRQIAAIVKDDPRLHFIDADPVLLTPEGKVDAELLRFDGIHLNRKGYAAWASLIKPPLLAAYGPAEHQMSSPQPVAIEAIRTPEIAARYLATYDALLRKWPVAFESLQIVTRYGSTHVIASGPPGAPPVVLLHAFQATALAWRANVEGLSRHFRVYALDVIGQGGKSASTGPLRKRTDFAAWMCELFDALGIKQAAIVGNSYGGFLALSQASLAPSRVSAVVLINPGGTFVSFLPHLLSMLWSQCMQALRLRPKTTNPDISKMLGRNVLFRPDEAEWASLVTQVAFNKEVRPNATMPVCFARRNYVRYTHPQCC